MPPAAVGAEGAGAVGAGGADGAGAVGAGRAVGAGGVGGAWRATAVGWAPEPPGRDAAKGGDPRASAGP